MKTESSTVIARLNEKLENFENNPSLNNAKKVILSIINLLDKSLDPDDLDQFKLFTDSDGKIRANSSWFFEDEVIVDRKAIYKIHDKNNINFEPNKNKILKINKIFKYWKLLEKK